MKNRFMTPWDRINFNTPGDPGGGTPPAPPAGNPPAPGGNPPTPAPGNPPAPGGDPAFPILKPNHEGTPPAPGNPPAPGGDNPPAPPPYAEFITPPAEGKYEAFTVPEGFSLDQGLVDKFQPLAAQLGLSQRGAQTLADFYAKEIVGPQSAAFVEQIASWFDETQKDAEVGGAKFEQSTVNASKALSVFGTPGLRKVLVEYGLGNHPEFVRFFARVGGAIGEDNANGGKGGAGTPKTDFLTKMYGPPKTNG